MTLSANISSTNGFRSVLLGSTAMLVGMAFVFGAGLATPAAAETLTWNNAAPNDNWDQDDDADDQDDTDADPAEDAGQENWTDADDNPEDFNEGDDAIFAGTAETVTVTEDVKPSSITFNSSGYLIQADPTNMNSGDLNIVFNRPATIDVATTDAGGDPDPAGTANIGAVVRFLDDVTINGASEDSVGTLTLSGANQDRDNSSRQAATITLARGGLTIAGGGQIGFEDSLVATGGLLTIEGSVNVGGMGNPLDRGTVTIGGAGELSLQGGTIFGQTLITGGSGAALGGDFNGGVLMTGGTLDIEATTSGSIINGEEGGSGGTLTINQFAADGTTPVTLDGSVTNNAGATVNNGRIDGTVVQSGGTVNNNGATDATITGAVTVSGGAFTNSGDLERTLDITGGTFDNQTGGAITGLATVGDSTASGPAGTLTASGGDFNNGIAVQANGTLVVTADTGTDLAPVGVANNGGTIDIQSGTLTTDLFDQQAGVTDNAGVIVGAVDVAGGIFNNNVDGDINGALDISGAGIVNANGGTFQQNIDINGGTLNINSDFDETAAGAVQTNLNSGQINVGVGAAAPVTFTTDFETAGGTTTISANGILDNVDAVDDTILLDAGILVNSGRILDQVRVEDGGTLGVAGGVFDEGIDAQGGNINITESSEFAAPGLINNGSTIVISGQEASSMDPLTVTGNVTNRSGTIASSGNIEGTLTVTAAADGGGAVSQFTQNADTAAGQGVTGQVIVSGANTANQGVLVVQGGTFTDINVQEFGRVNIGDDIIGDADATGDVVNNGGTVEITATGQLTGSLTNNAGTSTIVTGGVLQGPLNVAGTVGASTVNVGGVVRQNAAGDLVTVTGGTLNLNAGADVQVGIVQNGGAINANSGFFNSGLNGQAGTIDINGPADGNNGQVSGHIFVRGSQLDINENAVLTGQVTMTTEATATNAATNSGTLTGLLTSQGGVFNNSGIIQGPGNPEGDVIVVAGGQVNNNGGDVTATSRVQSGTLVASGGNFTGSVIVEETTVDTSTFNVVADMSGDIINNSMMPSDTGAGAVTINAGTIVTGNVTNNSGQATVNGQISGTAGDDGILNVTGGEVITSADTIVDRGTNVSGGTLTANGGTFTGGIIATGGQTNVEGSITIGSGRALASDDGTVDIAQAGRVTGNVRAINSDGSADGTVTNLGQIVGSVTVGAADEMGDGAVFNNSGNISAGVTVNNGTFNMDAGQITAASNVNGGGSFVVTDNAAIAGVATFNAGVTNSGGEVRIEGDAQGDIRNNAGQATINDTFTLTGDVTNGNLGQLDLNGDVDGTLGNNGGIVNAAGMVTGASTNQNTADTGGDGRIFVADADTATFTNGLRNFGNGLIRVEGTLNGAVTNQNTGEVRVAGGELGGTLTNDAGGAANFNGTTAATIINNSGALNVGDAAEGVGNLTTTGLLTNFSGGVVNVTAGSTLDAAGVSNNAGGIVNLNGFLDSTITNDGQIFVNNGAGNDGLFGGLVTNRSSNSIYLNGSADSSDTLRFGDGLNNTGTVDAATNSSFVGDIIDIDGPLSGNGLFRLDINLDDQETGNAGADLVQVSGPVTGNVILDFVLDETNGRQDNVLVFDVNDSLGAANDFTFSVRGLPDASEAIIYTPTRTAAGDILIEDALNPGIGGLAGSIVLTQSLIGSVVNRPSSPFVSGLAYDDPDPCGAGGWARAIGGEAESSGNVTELIDGGLTLKGEIDANYYGVQLGGDIACFNGYFDGWDISIGGIGGVNSGTTEQPVFGLVSDNNGGLVLGDEVSSITTVDFDQAYGGVYVTGARDRFSIDLQYRIEQTDFVADNVGVRGSGLGLENSEFGSDATTFSGSVSYAFPLGDSNVTFVPTGGFAYTNVSTEEIVFNDTSTVQVNDFTAETLFAGGTLARTVFGDDGTTATNQFATVTFYNDFADSPTSLFTPRGDVVLEPRSVVGENLGAYAELSAGLNYIRILPVGAPAGAKQLSASIRGDLRSSEQLSSWGITSQFRVQF